MANSSPTAGCSLVTGGNRGVAGRCGAGPVADRRGGGSACEIRGPRSDSCGIVAAGRQGERAFVLADESLARATPTQWSRGGPSHSTGFRPTRSWSR